MEKWNIALNLPNVKIKTTEYAHLFFSNVFISEPNHIQCTDTNCVITSIDVKTSLYSEIYLFLLHLQLDI